MLCIKEWEMSLFAEKIALQSSKMTTWDAVVKKLKQSLNYWKNYEKRIKNGKKY